MYKSRYLSLSLAHLLARSGSVRLCLCGKTVVIYGSSCDATTVSLDTLFPLSVVVMMIMMMMLLFFFCCKLLLLLLRLLLM